MSCYALRLRNFKQQVELKNTLNDTKILPQRWRSKRGKERICHNAAEPVMADCNLIGKVHNLQQA
jgi:hypothetical protein